MWTFDDKSDSTTWCNSLNENTQNISLPRDRRRCNVIWICFSFPSVNYFLFRIPLVVRDPRLSHMQWEHRWQWRKEKTQPNKFVLNCTQMRWFSEHRDKLIFLTNEIVARTYHQYICRSLYWANYKVENFTFPKKKLSYTDESILLALMYPYRYQFNAILVLIVMLMNLHLVAAAHASCIWDTREILLKSSNGKDASSFKWVPTK